VKVEVDISVEKISIDLMMLQVLLWNMDNFKMDSKIEDHTNFITDIRFKANSTQLATSSSDGTIRLWNAADVMLSKLTPFHLLILCL
jgi:WD40 repeat protein